ncbi:MAG: DNA-processing protein DprA [Candidatus Hydrogenedentes bacterium]|nr:DNA-processing protein DprA [Candidatus Hydrogenedentota bacterium]
MALTQEQREWLTLTLVPGVGTTLFIRLLARFRTPAAVLRAPKHALQDVVGEKLAQRITQYSDVVDVDAQERAMAKYGVTLLTMEDPRYPLRLAEIYDPPLVLFVRGELRDEDQNCVALVGTRRATPYGLRMAEKFGREMAARNVTVVSGLALGVDAAAHQGAIDAGGRTVAVLGCGVDIAYPPQNADLMQDITKHGCVISQFPMGMKPSAGHFPYRNRIISGMTMGTLVIEAPLSSGALITARQAAEQGREVFAVPGQVGVLNSQGPHLLIREGAKLVETVEDILVELNLPADVRTELPRPAASRATTSTTPRTETPAPQAAFEPAPPPPQRPPAPTPEKPSQPAGLERMVLKALSPTGTHVDEISAACRISISDALSTLTLLELKGLVRQFSGKRFAPQ